LCDGCESVCGDGIVAGDEVCDGDAPGASCESLGFLGGTLNCSPACDAYDTTACVSASGDCCSANATPGCDDPVCTADVCDASAECCSEAWDDACAQEAASSCLACGGSVPGFPCVEETLGSSLGDAVAAGSTVGEDQDFVPSCGGGGAEDRVLLWAAPYAGSFTADTVGSDYDTVLAVHTACEAAELLCDDDAGGGGASMVTGMLPAGGEVVIVVSGDSGGTGNWVLNIHPT
jgi:hypothetical protein